MTPGIDPEVYASLLQHFSRYFQAADLKDLDAIMAMMEGTTFTVGGVVLTDPEEIRSMYAARQPEPHPDGRRATKHHITNLIVDGPDDEGRYAATAYYFRLQPGESGPVIATSGRLVESLARVGGGWRIIERAIITDF